MTFPLVECISKNSLAIGSKKLDVPKTRFRFQMGVFHYHEVVPHAAFNNSCLVDLLDITKLHRDCLLTF